ncbi:MAG: aminotransferase class V-fold PLP-dependent enzyme [Deltaproteobacteria bacterium]|jgi:selenocysteine lyase/cysteine desulfurase|nr:aminotransferase class V-fold PLP-dependent enzyme [Deltaproteobacteria bacterium]MBT4527833.1 aminotransferase class V-fold PLP-dependent enzyme [Deltaproteobacteria bacterium]
MTKTNNKNDKINEIRNLMPAVKSIHYLNAGTNGPLPKCAADAMKKEAEEEFKKGRYLPFIDDLYKEMDITRNLLAGILSANYKEIALTHSTTEALNIVLWGLRWNSGDEIITTNMEHTAGLAILAMLRARHNITIKYINVDYGERYNEKKFLADLENKITSRTRLLLVSHVSFSTGLTFPIKKIVKLCHKYKVYVLVDGAQAAGAIPVNVQDLKVDFYAAAGRKWLCGPEGIGVLYIAQHRIPEVDPIFISPASVDQRHNLDIHSPYVIPAPFAARYHTATAMYKPTLLGFQKSLEFLVNQVKMDWITDRIPGLARYFKELIQDIKGIDIVTPPGTEGGFLCFNIKNQDPIKLCDILNKKGFMVRPVPKPHTPTPIRISTGFYNTEKELEDFAKTLKAVVHKGS